MLVSITVILVEEEDKPSISAHTTPSQSQDDSVLHGEVAGVVFNGDNMQEDGDMPEARQPPVNSTQRTVLAGEPEHPPGGIQNLETSPGGGNTGDADNAAATWIGSLSQVEKDALD